MEANQDAIRLRLKDCWQSEFIRRMYLMSHRNSRNSHPRLPLGVFSFSPEFELVVNESFRLFRRHQEISFFPPLPKLKYFIN